MKFQIQLCLLHLCLRGGDHGLRRLIRLNVVIQLSLRNGALFGQRGISCHVELRLAKLRFGLGQLPLSLLQGRFERTWIDLEKHLTLVNHGTFLVVLLRQVAGHLRLDLSVHVAVEGRDAFGIKRNVLLYDGRNFDFRRGGSRGYLLLATPCLKCEHSYQDESTLAKARKP